MHGKEADGGAWLAGINPVFEQLKRDPRAIRRVLVARGARGRAAEIAEQAKRAGLEVVWEDARRLERFAEGVPHQGVVALLAAYEYSDWNALLERKPGCVLVADQITDPRNLGALVRSAEAAGV